MSKNLELFSEEVTYTTAGGETKTVTVRGKHYVKPRGYVRPPGTGPAGETCGSCQHKHRREGVAGRYLKCSLARGLWTGGRASDILAGSPACEKWERREVKPEPITAVMAAALAQAMECGGLTRRAGGFWGPPGTKTTGPECFGTPTIEGLVARGRLKYTEYKEGRLGPFPIRVGFEPACPQCGGTSTADRDRLCTAANQDDCPGKAGGPEQ